MADLIFYYQHASGPVKWAATLVLIQSIIVSVLFMIVVGLNLARRLSSAARKRRRAGFLKLPRSVSLGSRQTYSKFLLERMAEAPRNNELVEIYKNLGFFSKNLRELKSRLWWRRFSAIASLDRVGISEGISALKPLLDDSHPAVRVAAARAVLSERTLGSFNSARSGEA